jgi:hypothetical protein
MTPIYYTPNINASIENERLSILPAHQRMRPGNMKHTRWLKHLPNQPTKSLTPFCQINLSLLVGGRFFQVGLFLGLDTPV